MRGDGDRAVSGSARGSADCSLQSLSAESSFFLFFFFETVPRRRTNSQASQTEPTGPTLICYKRPRDCGGPASPWAIDCYDSNPNKQTPPRRRRPQQSPPTLPRRRSWSADFPPSPSRESLLLGEQSGELPAVASAGVAQQTAVRSISG
jgi:hypothetical protein